MKITPLRGLALAGALVACGTAAYAQVAPPPPGAGPRPPMRERLDPAAMAAHKAERLRTVLQLTPQQEPALRAFIDATKPPEGLGEKFRAERQARQAMTTPQRLDRQKARMAERAAAFDRRADAVKRFYAQLTPSQQKAFDALGPMGGRRGGMGGHRGHGGGGRMGHGPA